MVQPKEICKALASVVAMVLWSYHVNISNSFAQSCKTDRLTVWKVPCLSRQSIAGQIVAGTCIYICEALRDCFTFIYLCKKRQSIPAGKRKFTPPSFGKECKRQCREDAAVKL